MSRSEPREILDIYKFDGVEAVSLNGPKCPTMTQLPESFLDHVRPSEEEELGYGFVPVYPCLRALQEAPGSLL